MKNLTKRRATMRRDKSGRKKRPGVQRNRGSRTDGHTLSNRRHKHRPGREGIED